MKERDRLKMLQKRLAAMQLQKAAKGSAPGGPLSQIRIDLVMGPRDGADSQQWVMNRIAPSAG